METRKLNRNVPKSNLPAKSLGVRQRTTLGQVTNRQNEPRIRMTRAQQLRNKMIEKKNENQPRKRVHIEKKAETEIEHVPVAEPEAESKPEEIQQESSQEAMEVSLSDDAKKELQEKIEQNTKEDLAEDYFVGPYVENMYEYLRYLEHKYAIKPRYLDDNPEVNGKMRSILVDWLVQVHKRFKLTADTLYLTVGILDRYLSSCESIKKSDMQLIGITSLMIACKVEEIMTPEVDDYVYICDNAYTQEQILKKELEIFHALDYNVGHPMSINFLRRYSNMAHVDGRQHAMAKYFLELALVEYDLMPIKPSVIAAASLNLALQLLGDQEWSPLLVHYSEYTNDELKPVVNILCRALYQIEYTKRGQKLAAVKKKFAESKSYCISVCEEITANKDRILHLARKVKEPGAN